MDVVGHVLDLGIIALVGRRGRRGLLERRHGRETGDTGERGIEGLEAGGRGVVVAGEKRRSGGEKAGGQSAGSSVGHGSQRYTRSRHNGRQKN